MIAPVLETGRLRLRPWRPEDAPALYAYASHPEVGPAAGWRPHATLAESRKWTALWSSPACPEPIWAITERGEDRPFGAIALHTGEDPACPTLGYTLAQGRWGHGLMAEAATAVLAWAFGPGGFARVRTWHYPENGRSRRVIEKCGFRYVTTFDRGRPLFHPL